MEQEDSKSIRNNKKSRLTRLNKTSKQLFIGRAPEGDTSKRKEAHNLEPDPFYAPQPVNEEISLAP